jgi:flagellar secretion chaperone FliS
MPASDQAATNAYLANKVLSAKPEELRLMLLDGALKFCRQGRDALERKDFEGVYNGFQRTRAILVELISTMKPEPDPVLYQRLSSLYLFMISHLLESSHSKDVTKANEVIKLLEYERETWVMLMKKLEGERVGKQPTGPAAPAAPAAKPVPGVASTLSLAG